MVENGGFPRMKFSPAALGHERRTQRILVIGNGHALVGGQHLPARVHADPVQTAMVANALRRHAAYPPWLPDSASPQPDDAGSIPWHLPVRHVSFLSRFEGHGSDQTFSSVIFSAAWRPGFNNTAHGADRPTWEV
jgi:hypothetical protein